MISYISKGTFATVSESPPTTVAIAVLSRQVAFHVVTILSETLLVSLCIILWCLPLHPWQ